MRCNIGYLAHKHVFARGRIPCDVLLIGEAPGKTENAMGYPFIGRSGELLEEWLQPHRAQFEFAITNTVLCRPTDKLNGDNRQPTTQEIANCDSRLFEFIALSRCRAYIMVGKVAADHMRKQLDMPQLHLMHPAGVLRRGGKGSPADKQQREALASFLEGI